MKSNPFIAYGATLGAIVLWGLSYIWMNQLIGLGIPVEYFVFVRVVIGIVFLLCFNLICGYSLKLHKKDLGTFLLLALCEPLVYFICETYGVKLTESPTYSALIISMTPVLAFVAGVVFFKEKITRLNVLGIIICLAGLTLVTWVSSTVGREFVWGVVLLYALVPVWGAYAKHGFKDVDHAAFFCWYILCTIEVPDMGYTMSFSVTNDQANRLRPGDTATVVTGRRLGHPVRSIKNQFAREYGKIEYTDISDEELDHELSAELEMFE